MNDAATIATRTAVARKMKHGEVYQSRHGRSRNPMVWCECCAKLHTGSPCPRPHEIRQRCAAIQETWTDDMHARRAGGYGDVDAYVPTQYGPVHKSYAVSLSPLPRDIFTDNTNEEY